MGWAGWLWRLQLGVGILIIIENCLVDAESLGHRFRITRERVQYLHARRLLFRAEPVRRHSKFLTHQFQYSTYLPRPKPKSIENQTKARPKSNRTTHAKSHQIFPYLHSFSNHSTTTNHLLKSVFVPDVCPSDVLDPMDAGGEGGRGEFSLVAGDFEEVYGSRHWGPIRSSVSEGKGLSDVGGAARHCDDGGRSIRVDGECEDEDDGEEEEEMYRD